MRLAAYLRENNETACHFAARCRPPLARSTVSRIMSGSRKPSSQLMYQIQTLTQGAVTISDWPKIKRRAASAAKSTAP